MIITKHAPLDVAAAGAVTAAFHLSGQVCTSAERFFVVDEIHDRFVDLFAERTRKLRIGNGMDESEIGPLVSEAARAKVMRLVDDAMAHGANAVTGGRVPPSQERRLVLRADHPDRRHARHGDLPRGMFWPGRRDLPGEGFRRGDPARE